MTWTRAAIAGRRAEQTVTLSASRAGRILAAADLRPYTVRGWLNRRAGPAFRDRAADICDLHASWPNQIEPRFSAPVEPVIRYGASTGRDDLIAKTDSYRLGRNETAKPYRWTDDGTPLTSA